MTGHSFAAQPAATTAETSSPSHAHDTKELTHHERVVPQDVADGDGPMKDAVDLLNDQIEYLKSLLADLLTDCENWGCAPNERYAEALR